MEPMQYFGEPYPSAETAAPIYEDSEQVPTPVGATCYHCKERVAEGERGFFQFTLPPAPPGGMLLVAGLVPDFMRMPIHHECFMRGVTGSVGHQRGTCSCHGGSEEDPPGMTRREAARAAVLEMERLEKLKTGS